MKLLTSKFLVSTIILNGNLIKVGKDYFLSQKKLTLTYSYFSIYKLNTKSFLMIYEIGRTSTSGEHNNNRACSDCDK